MAHRINKAAKQQTDFSAFPSFPPGRCAWEALSAIKRTTFPSQMVYEMRTMYTLGYREILLSQTHNMKLLRITLCRVMFTTLFGDVAELMKL